MYRCEPVSDVVTALGEGPFWEAKTGRVLYVDILGKAVLAYDTRSGHTEQWSTPEMVSAVFPAASGGYVLTLEHSVARCDARMRFLETVCELGDGPGNRLNDAKCDARGRMWLGSMNKDVRDASAALYRLDVDHSLTRVRDEVVVSNGIAWSPDSKVMYYTDTQTYRLDAFDYDLATASIANRRIVISLPYDNGFSDGMAVDVEGFIWLALWRGAKVVRIDPSKGRIVEEIPVPAYLATSVCFAGPDLSDLYITSATCELTDEQKGRYPLSGKLFKVRTGTRGLVAAGFAG